MTRTMLAPVRADGLPRPPHVRRHTLIGITVRGLTLLLLSPVVRPYVAHIVHTQASGLIYAAESGSNTQITDFFDALYFGLTTLTTVGFGDITPVTPVGRLIVSASTVVGIALVPLQLTGLAETLLKETRAREAQQKKPMGYRVDRLARRCEVCSEKAHRRDARFCFRCGAELPP